MMAIVGAQRARLLDTPSISAHFPQTLEEESNGKAMVLTFLFTSVFSFFLCVCVCGGQYVLCCVDVGTNNADCWPPPPEC